MGMSKGFPMTNVYSIWMYHLFRCFYARTELMRTSIFLSLWHILQLHVVVGIVAETRPVCDVFERSRPNVVSI